MTLLARQNQGGPPATLGAATIRRGAETVIDPDAHCRVLKLCHLGEVPLEKLKAMLEQEEDWAARDQYGDNALTFCARMDKFEAFKIIYEHGRAAKNLITDGSELENSTSIPMEQALVLESAKGRISPGLLMAAGGLAPAAIHQLIEHLERTDLLEPEKEPLRQFFRSLAGVNDLATMKKLVTDGTILTPTKAPIIEAAWSGKTTILDYLIAQGASVDERDEKDRTALMIVAKVAFANGNRENNFAVARKLIAAKTDINARDLQEMTPLMHAASSGCGPIIKLLSEAGVDWQALDRAGNSALDHLNIYVGDVKGSFSSLSQFEEAFSSQP